MKAMMTQKEKRILKKFAAIAQEKAGMRRGKNYIPMSRMILLEASSDNPVKDIYSISYVMFEDAKTKKQYQCFRKNGIYEVEEVYIRQPTAEEINELLKVNPKEILENVKADILTNEEIEQYIDVK